MAALLPLPPICSLCSRSVDSARYESRVAIIFSDIFSKTVEEGNDTVGLWCRAVWFVLLFQNGTGCLSPTEGMVPMFDEGRVE